ncbi:putative oxidoreductase [Lipomyces starkeyi]
MRYLEVVQKVHLNDQGNNLTVIRVIDRYANAYQRVRKVDWRTKSQQGGPVIEQGTHCCDLCGYIGPKSASIRATSVEYYELPGNLSLARLVPSRNTNPAL